MVCFISCHCTLVTMTTKQSLYWEDLLRERIYIYPFEIWLECMLHHLNAHKWLFHNHSYLLPDEKINGLGGTRFPLSYPARGGGSKIKLSWIAMASSSSSSNWAVTSFSSSSGWYSSDCSDSLSSSGWNTFFYLIIK